MWGYRETLPARKGSEAYTTKEGKEASFPKVIKNRLGKHLYSMAYAELRKGNSLALFFFFGLVQRDDQKG